MFFIFNFSLSYELSNEHKQQIIENSNLEYDLKLDIIDRFETASSKIYPRLKPEIKTFRYQNQCSSKTTNFRKHTYFVEVYDTHCENDVVRNQYSKLPYPLVTDQSLAKEKMYYDNNINPVKVYGTMRNKPYFVSYGTTLEAINHFLFQGKNHFRYLL